MHVDETNDGVLMRNTANDMRGNSTWTEIFGLMGAMLSDKAVHAGIDNLAMVKGATRAIEHVIKRTKAVLRQVNGGLRLRGRLSPLHRESPWFRPLCYISNGDG